MTFGAGLGFEGSPTKHGRTEIPFARVGLIANLALAVLPFHVKRDGGRFPAVGALLELDQIVATDRPAFVSVSEGRHSFVASFSYQHLQTVLAVIRLGSMAAAADSLHVSSSQVSRIVAQAETALGVRLLDRNGPRISLSPAAEILLPRLERLFQDMAEMARIGPALRTGDAGHLTVGYTRLTGLTALAPFIERLQTKYPGVSLTLVTAPDAELEEMLLTGRLDVGLLNLPLRNATLKHVSLHFDPFCLAVPTAWNAHEGIALADERIGSVFVAPFHLWPGMLERFQLRARELGLAPQMVETVNDAIGRMAMALSTRSAALVSQIRSRGCPEGISVVPLLGFQDLGFETVLTIAPDASPTAKRAFALW